MTAPVFYEHLRYRQLKAEADLYGATNRKKNGAAEQNTGATYQAIAKSITGENDCATPAEE